MYAGHDNRFDAMADYLAAGLQAGDKCAVFVPDETPDELIKRLGEAGARAVDDQQLEAGGADQTFFAPDQFDTDKMLAFWRERIASSTAGGYRAIRLTADGAWWGPQLPGGAELIRYESELNRLASDGPQSILCVYDLTTLSGAFVLDVLRVHAKIYFCGIAVPNPYYLTPDDYLALLTNGVGT